ncbi:redoxin domain-containing protein [Flavobacterium selenitireducens]|uniref:redoxin domain-containing protein n=1 Tax=Flavobacterium selenitireducens TaxID=2722704 RepID=UPI00168A913D|nr:thioredoxin-like domain-containing protein [Flavobacterium selenitireducens]MBD3583474.1 redoxin domain-containing protein [Flavobacterium selenitireducens]
MRGIIAFLLIWTYAEVSSQNRDFEVKGIVNGNFTGKAILSYEGRTDSVAVVDHTFEFSGSLKQQSALATLQLENSAVADEFYLEPGNLKLQLLTGTRELSKGDTARFFRIESVEGSGTQDRVNDFLKSMTDYKMERVTRFEVIAKGQSLIESYPENPASIFILEQLSQNFYATEMGLLNGLYAKVTPHPEFFKSYAKIYDRLFPEKVVQVKGPMRHFSLADEKGVTLHTESLSGNWILIDFWASWCAPCIEQFHYFKSLYGRPNLKIVSVSVDADKSDWLNACAKYKLPWPSVRCDLKNGDEVSSVYGISRGVPVTFLVDPDGIVVAKNPSKAELEAWIKS